MSLFEKIFGSKKERNLKADATFKTLNAYSPVFTNWNGSIYESELVRAAIESYASHMSKMSVYVAGSAQPALRTRLNDSPNEFQTWSQFLARLTRILLVNNTAIIVPVIDKYDNTTGIYPILPNYCTIVQHNGEPFIKYKFQSGETAAIELSRVGIMVRHQYSKDFSGDNNSVLKNTMALIDIQNQGITEGVKSAATYRFMAQLNSFALAEDVAEERKKFNALNLSKDAEGGGLLLLPNTYSNIKQIDSKPFVIDAEQMKIVHTNVYNYFGVNEKILQNSATADELDSFYNSALEPIAIQLSEVLTKMLFTSRERANGARIEVASNRLQYMSVSDKISMATQMGDRGLMTINEIRALFNYPAMDGGDRAPIRGEYYFVGEESEDE